MMPKPNSLYNARTEMVQKNASKTLPSTWSDPSVNISLDNLVPGMQPSKPQQPSLNTMMQQQSKWSLHCFVHTEPCLCSTGCPWDPVFCPLLFSCLSHTCFINYWDIVTQMMFSKWRLVCQEVESVQVLLLSLHHCCVLTLGILIFRTSLEYLLL